jgi:hypothetical protein
MVLTNRDSARVMGYSEVIQLPGKSGNRTFALAGSERFGRSKGQSGNLHFWCAKRCGEAQ